MGITGDLDLRDPEIQRWVVKTLTRPRLTGPALFREFHRHVNCDVLFDHPDKRHAARLVLWLAALDKVPMNSMKWFKRCIKYAKVHQWDAEKDAYGAAASYGRVLTCHV